jgi:pimeloyl-ACP methyl ester carboxylesterase
MYLAHVFQRPLEKHFTVVHWDRRGAGKSFRRSLPAEALKVSALLADAEKLILRLRERFGQDKIYLVGHSWGSYLGTLLVLNRPELFCAYVGVGQVVDEEAATSLQAEFIRREATRRGHDEAVEQIQGQGATAHEEWLFRYGGELAKHTSWMPFVLAGLRAPEYTLLDVFRVAQGSSFSSTNMAYDVIEGPLRKHVSAYPVPTYFFTGRHDWTTPYPLITEFFEEIEAPSKELVWFEESAHFPFFEEPEKFAEEMLRVRRDLGGRP